MDPDFTPVWYFDEKSGVWPNLDTIGYRNTPIQIYVRVPWRVYCLPYSYSTVVQVGMDPMETGKGQRYGYMGGRRTHEMAVLTVSCTHARANNEHNVPHRATSQHALDMFKRARRDRDAREKAEPVSADSVCFSPHVSRVG